MDVAAATIAAGAAEGVVVVADEQTSGRGRRGREWQSPPGAGLYLSIVFRPSRDAAGARVASLLTLAAGVAVRSGIGRATGLWADLKWPNDLLVGERKLAGILAEGHGIGTDAQAIVVGVGVNVRAVASIRACRIAPRRSRPSSGDWFREALSSKSCWSR